MSYCKRKIVVEREFNVTVCDICKAVPEANLDEYNRTWHNRFSTEWQHGYDLCPKCVERVRWFIQTEALKHAEPAP